MSERYTLPYGGREIYRDGNLFAILHRPEVPDANGDRVGRYACTPVELDDFGRRIVAALNETERPEVADPIALVCTECGGRDIQADANASWNEARQRYELDGVMDQHYCSDCDGEAKVDAIPLWIADSGLPGATPIEGGDRVAWHFKYGEGGPWYVSDRADVANGFDCLALLKRFGTRRMKAGWTPRDRSEVPA